MLLRIYFLSTWMNQFAFVLRIYMSHIDIRGRILYTRVIRISRNLNVPINLDTLTFSAFLFPFFWGSKNLLSQIRYSSWADKTDEANQASAVWCNNALNKNVDACCFFPSAITRASGRDNPFIQLLVAATVIMTPHVEIHRLIIASAV